MPFAYLFFSVGFFLTIFLKIPQFFAIGHFLSFITAGFKREQGSLKTIDAFHALFTSMASSIGIGTIVGPSLAIVIGGPGALFWLLLYGFFGAATKLVEVTLAVFYRRTLPDGSVMGGPAEYLKAVHPYFARWYGFATIFLFAGWSGIQSKALAEIGAQRGVPEYVTGFLLAFFIFVILLGGAQRVGNVASKLVPLMFATYVICSIWILASMPHAVLAALQSMFHSAFYPAAPVGGFLGATVYSSLKEGVFKSVFITESGMGTSSIAHAISDVKRPIDQGILAMYSQSADMFLCFLSGLLVLSSAIWHQGTFCNTLVLQVFEKNLPAIGPFFFLLSVTLFIATTAIGNSFNGGQSFATLTNYRWVRWYYFFVSFVIFICALVDVPLVWAIMDLVLPLVALPNLIGIVLLALRNRHLLRY